MTDTTPVRESETREMRLISRILADRGPLSTYLAKHRRPGSGWMTREQIAYDLNGLTGELFTRAGLTNWAERYGIPIASRPTDPPHAYDAEVERAARTIWPHRRVV